MDKVKLDKRKLEFVWKIVFKEGQGLDGFYQGFFEFEEVEDEYADVLEGAEYDDFKNELAVTEQILRDTFTDALLNQLTQ